MAFLQKTQPVLDTRALAGPQIYRGLRQRIISGGLAPGAGISESEIAQEYAVSRQPVREAFIKLAEEGLVEIRPQRGTFVSKISVAAVLDAQFVRTAIEAEIAKVLVGEEVKGLVGELRRQLAEQAKVREPSQFVALDELFHKTLAEAAGKTHAWHFVEGVKAQMDRVRHISARQFSIKKLIAQHKDIVDALAARDAVLAEKAVRGHLSEILNDFPAIAADKPEFFESPDSLQTVRKAS
ncbi:MAG: GntR family transcriptional regulator [Rhodospirillales bacterium]